MLRCARVLYAADGLPRCARGHVPVSPGSGSQLRAQVERFKVPSVMEYVGYKADMLATKKSVKTWNRRVEVAEQELRKHKVAWGMVSKADALSDMGMY